MGESSWARIQGSQWDWLSFVHLVLLRAVEFAEVFHFDPYDVLDLKFLWADDCVLCGRVGSTGNFYASQQLYQLPFSSLWANFGEENLPERSAVMIQYSRISFVLLQKNVPQICRKEQTLELIILSCRRHNFTLSLYPYV